MGIGRRKFIAQLGGLLGSVVVANSLPRFISSERFVSKDLGLSFLKPNGWIFIAPDAVQKAANDIGEKAGIGEMNPAVMNISKEKWQTNPKRFTPGINVWAHPSEQFQDSLDVFADSMISGQRFYRDFILSDKVERMTVSNCSASLHRASFIFETVGLDRPTPVDVRFLCIAQDERFYFIYMGDSPNLGFSEEANFSYFTESLIIA